MHFVTVRELRTQPGEVWKKLAEHHKLVVTRNGKPFAILTETSPTALEGDLQDLRSARFGQALQAVRADAKGQGIDKMTLEEINAVIMDIREVRRHEACD